MIHNMVQIRSFSVDRVFLLHGLRRFLHAVVSALAELTGAVGGLQAASIFPGADLDARLTADIMPLIPTPLRHAYRGGGWREP